MYVGEMQILHAGENPSNCSNIYAYMFNTLAVKTYVSLIYLALPWQMNRYRQCLYHID